MRKCPIKRGLKPDTRKLLKECFGSEPKENDGKFSCAYGSLTITAWIEDKCLFCETTLPQNGVDEKAIPDIIKRHNVFL